MNEAELKNRFLYHAPDAEKARAHERVRTYIMQMALEFNDSLPEGREKSLAMTHLEEAMFWANASLARN